MRKAIGLSLALACALLSLSWIAGSQEKNNDMTFFITSVGSGKGADLGGLAGADKHCQSLAQAAGAGNRTWRAYLSTSPSDGKPAVNARDRIGKGPWQNAKGVVVAKDVNDLHSNNNKINKETALTEKGEPINARGDKPNMHDILTGSQLDGRAFTSGEDMTCRNWTAAPSAPPCSAITTAKVCVMTNRRDHGILHIHPAARAADAARKDCGVPAAFWSSCL